MYWWLLGKEKMLKDDTAAIILDGVEIVQKVNNVASIENKTEQQNKYFSAEQF
jgi:hypothetical protein